MSGDPTAPLPRRCAALPLPEGERERVANPLRGEAALRVAGEMLVLRPSFSALVAAEAELGSLFTLVGRAAEGGLTLAEAAALCWHCRHEAPAALTRARFADALAAGGLAAAAPAVGVLLGQIVSGR